MIEALFLAQLSFRETLVNTIVDKLIIGLIVLIAGYFVSRKLESYKAAEGIRSEIAKETVKHIAEAWSILFAWEQQVRELATQVQKAGQFTPQINTLYSQASSAQTAVVNRAHVDRIWMGEELFHAYLKYHNVLIAFLTSIQSATLSDLDEPREAVFVALEKFGFPLNLQTSPKNK